MDNVQNCDSHTYLFLRDCAHPKSCFRLISSNFCPSKSTRTEKLPSFILTRMHSALCSWNSQRSNNRHVYEPRLNAADNPVTDSQTRLNADHARRLWSWDLPTPCSLEGIVYVLFIIFSRNELAARGGWGGEFVDVAGSAGACPLSALLVLWKFVKENSISYHWN
jgi:hypothetical protein